MANPWGLIHAVGTCESQHKQVRVNLRAALDGNSDTKWMVQALAICVECGYRVSQSEWVELPDLDAEVLEVPLEAKRES